MPQPRALGDLSVTSKTYGDASVLGDLYQSGCLKALFPRANATGLTGVFLNTSGGMTGGDRLTLHATAEANSRLILTSQAAERVYLAQPGPPAQLTTTLRVADAARIDWLPQETILFNGAALRRRLEVDLAPDAAFFGVEPLVFGRVSMGETLTKGQFADNITIRRDGVPIFADAVRLSGDIAGQMSGPATAAGQFAMASLIYAAADADALLKPLRALLPATAGASLIRPGVLYARILAPDSYILRQSLVPIIARLHGAAPPKTWML
ncbi:urease accessory protein [Sulfitobacter marinus]|uniref:Urease accessory protein UreD n=1 Tax=Sulfitobacter marinus TaxID=394264 RepID=A0A1I6UX67_9RHOB|nr:urease accessory protein UreD [Sulfitobacter marinus]SFT06029.1 urease accessory protein [Sulfitobacter marinus]